MLKWTWGEGWWPSVCIFQSHPVVGGRRPHVPHHPSRHPRPDVTLAAPLDGNQSVMTPSHTIPDEMVTLHNFVVSQFISANYIT